MRSEIKTFQFMQAAQTLDMKLNAMRSELEMLRKINERLRAELRQQAIDREVSHRSALDEVCQHAVRPRPVG
jgi:hypothetical protein